MVKKSNKKVIIITALVVAVFVIVALALTSKEITPPLEEGEEKTVTYEPVMEIIKAPEPDEVIEDKTVAVPEVSIDAAPGVTDKKLRRFSITADNETFTPSEIIVNQGDTVQVNFVAIDNTYDITFPDYSMKGTAKAGETKFLGFQALRSGKFLFYCEICVGRDRDVTGHFTIVPRE